MHPRDRILEPWDACHPAPVVAQSRRTQLCTCRSSLSGAYLSVRRDWAAVIVSCFIFFRGCFFFLARPLFFGRWADGAHIPLGVISP